MFLIRRFLSTQRRPPVVTIMGHVDHGKTTLLDYLRRTHVAASEAGGITQKIGAFSVNLNGSAITFLDTPGHAAFSGIRKRGSRVTDLVVLVVSADDGVMAQTKESIELIKDNELPVVVAINKIDKFQQNLASVKDQLMREGLILEERGGEVQVVPVSALKGTNVPELLNSILAQAEMLDLTSRSDGLVEGVVLETRVLPHLGECATILVQAGTLRPGAILVAEEAVCRVKRILDAETAVPSTPAEVIGWKSLPPAGAAVKEHGTWDEAIRMVEERKRMREQIEQVDSEAQVQHLRQLHDKLREVVKAQRDDRNAIKRNVLTYEEITQQDTRPCLKLIFRCDAIGTQEAFDRLVEEIPQGKARLELVSSAVGPVTESDLRMAQAAGARICAFAQEPSKSILKLASHLKVPISHHAIIYHLIDHLKAELASLLPPVWREEPLGRATILQTFTFGNSLVAGCRIDEGLISKNPSNIGQQQKYSIRLLRGGRVVHEPLSIKSMRHEKKEISQAQKGMECGIQFNYEHFEIGDEVRIILQTPTPDSL